MALDKRDGVGRLAGRDGDSLAGIPECGARGAGRGFCAHLLDAVAGMGADRAYPAETVSVRLAVPGAHAAGADRCKRPLRRPPGGATPWKSMRRPSGCHGAKSGAIPSSVPDSQATIIRRVQPTPPQRVQKTVPDMSSIRVLSQCSSLWFDRIRGELAPHKMALSI